VTAFARGSGAIGTQGVGFVAVSPCLANDKATAFATDSGFTSATIKPLNGVVGNLTTGVAESFSNSPYTADQLADIPGIAPGVNGRVVAVSLRIRYTGTELNRSGNVYAYSDPARQTLYSLSATQLAARAGTIVSEFGREFTQVDAHIQTGYEAAYSKQAPGTSPYEEMDSLYPYSDGKYMYDGLDVASVRAPGSVCLAAMVDGVPGATFYYEVVLHLEFIGIAASAVLTPSDVDATGTLIVATALDRIPRMIAAIPHDVRKRKKHYLLKALTAVWHEVKPLAPSIIAAMLA